MSAAVDKMEASVGSATTVMSGAVTLLGQLSTLLRATAGDTDKVNALADELDARKAALAQAIVDNTPAA